VYSSEFWKPYVGQAVGGGLDLMLLTSGAEWAAIQWERRTDCLSCLMLPELAPLHPFYILSCIYDNCKNYEYMTKTKAPRQMTDPTCLQKGFPTTTKTVLFKIENKISS
jgi:hypothetical protein